MTQNSGLFGVVEVFARSKGTSLAPGWYGDLENDRFDLNAESLTRLCASLGWPAPSGLSLKPRPDQFPLLLWSPGTGFAVAEQWCSELLLRIAGDAPNTVPYSEDMLFFDIEFPDPLQGGTVEKAIDVFWRAVLRRRNVLMTAALATIVANVLTLATSLYSMQLFDRVIPLGSFSTLWVLTVGVLIALLIDLIIRTTRALMIEREAAEIDAEVSEYFFARAQAVRLDVRPPGIGTMAAQLRGLEQVRGIMSSTSLFLVADLPFALLFILVVYWIGGVVALVPIISLPVALLTSFFIARSIRAGTEKAQVSGNRKNGMLVESLDAVETIKANRGNWFMLARWNRLIREVHHYEDPIKRTSAFTASVFASLQQFAYVLLMAVGAYEVAQGRLTAGGLLACSIIAGRINGPLISMLPNLIVQWGYAKSSLKALDAIMALPIERGTEQGAIRPGKIAGSLLLADVKFGYAGAREGIDIPRLEIRPGERVAIIGGVGSGKSTLLRLMAGLFLPQQGSVTLGGLDVAQIAEDILRNHVGYIPQDYRLVNGTLRENLLMGLGSISDEVLLRCAQQTGVDRMIAAHPKGLDLMITEGGRGLSGGQRGLVGITRLLLGTPELLMLDEPTASLDQGAEQMVMASVVRLLTPGRTLILVTHRLQLLSAVQRVIVMGQGRVVMDGPTSEVIARLSANRSGPQAVKPNVAAE
ncbi:ATP-binding cassette domain-containing protein [Sandarakinorhabdus sp.]|uniref:ATP-binding cassette domain-containing protein n=1 Tax=Sandarakinorhabdus sp. TaxID=1916663 RepID=UPI003F6F4195